MDASNHFVYILKCGDNTLYTGYTTDVSRRVKMHEQGKGAKYTRGRGPFKVMYTAQYPTKSEAMQVEYQLKQLTRKEKEQVINNYIQGGMDYANTKKF